MKRVPLIHIIIATGFGSGFSPFAPGTAGALLATLIWLALSCAVSPTLLLIITALLIGIFTIAGIRSANAVEPIWGEDPSRVVVDEMVGVWIPLLAAPTLSADIYFVGSIRAIPPVRYFQAVGYTQNGISQGRSRSNDG